MARYSSLALGVSAALLLSACANRGGDTAGGPVEEAVSAGGIQTSAIRAAPATQGARNESRPLSELNTPEAVAAREAAARSAPRRPAEAPLAPASPDNSATAATEALMASNDPHKQIPGLQKGSKVRVRSGATLRSRPSGSSESLQSVPLNGELELGPQVYNADGYWWYIAVGKETGWLQQTDIAR